MTLLFDLPEDKIRKGMRILDITSDRLGFITNYTPDPDKGGNNYTVDIQWDGNNWSGTYYISDEILDNVVVYDFIL